MINTCEFCVYGKDFHEMHARLRGQNILLILHQIIKKNLISLV